MLVGTAAVLGPPLLLLVLLLAVAASSYDGQRFGWMDAGDTPYTVARSSGQSVVSSQAHCGRQPTTHR